MLLESVLITTPVSAHLDTLGSYVTCLSLPSVMSIPVKTEATAPWWQQCQFVNAQKNIMAHDVKVSTQTKQLSLNYPFYALCFYCIVLAADECKENDIRLIGGQKNKLNEGRVEVCAKIHTGQLKWGAVCSDGWDKNDATVACRQLKMPG